eukprot:10745032-Alexandrium_andersonii.AAC.1
MSASLVGSEMCIRDRLSNVPSGRNGPIMASLWTASHQVPPTATSRTWWWYHPFTQAPSTSSAMCHISRPPPTGLRGTWTMDRLRFDGSMTKNWTGSTVR